MSSTNSLTHDAEEYDLESFENILQLGWSARVRPKVNHRPGRLGSGRRPRAFRRSQVEAVSSAKKDIAALRPITKPPPPKIPEKSPKNSNLPSDADRRHSKFRLPPQTIFRPHYQPARLRTVSILDTLTELARGPQNSPRSHVADLDILATTTTNTTIKHHPRLDVHGCRRPTGGNGGRGRTPDWIRGIFDLVKRGQSEKLLLALKEMDAILIRNLCDHHGNNLFHACAAIGQVECLRILLERGKECEEALYDENKQGLTPAVLSVKKGHVAFLKCLLDRPSTHDRVLSPEDSRPLLHWAAKYGQDNVLQWLLESPLTTESNVNIRDHEGNTALHLASRCGHAGCIKILVEHQADLTLQNHLGHKPADTAQLFGQTACVEYLIATETCLLLACDVSSAEEDLHNFRMEFIEWRNHFREVLASAKKSLKERDELGVEFDILRNQVSQLNEQLVTEMQVLMQENMLLRESMNGGRKKETHEERFQTILEQCRNVHQQWQLKQKQWFSESALNERECHLTVAEERWRRMRSRLGRTANPCRYPANIFSERLRQVRCRSATIRLEEARALSTSESSLSSVGSVEMEANSEQPVLINSVNPTAMLKPRINEESPARRRQFPHRSVDANELKRLVSRVSNIPGPAVPMSRDSPSLVKLLGELTVSNLGPPLTTFNDPDDVTCTVLEVIEPLSSEHRTGKKAELATNVSSVIVEDVRKELKDKSSDVTTANDNSASESLKSDKLTVNSTIESETSSPKLNEDAKRDPSIPTDKCDAELKSVFLAEPDLIKDSRGIREWENVGVTASSDVLSEDSSDVVWMPEDGEGSESSPTPRLRLPSRCVDGFSCSPSKKKGFLQKFALRWSSKRKDVKSPKKNHEITPEEYRETYMCRGDGSTDSLDIHEENSACSNWEDQRTDSERGSVLVDRDLNSNSNVENCDSMSLVESKTEEEQRSELSNPSAVKPDSPNQTDSQTPILTLSDLAASHSDSAMFELWLLPTKSGEMLSEATSKNACSNVSKPEPFSRLDFAALKAVGFPLRKSSSVSADMLHDSSTVSRMSPAPSEVSKTESALFSPPSDLSHTESIRHSQQQLCRIEEIAKREPSNRVKHADNITVTESKIKIDASPQKLKNEQTTMQSAGEQPGLSTVKKCQLEAKPWYDVSDDEDLFSPERLQKTGMRIRSSSDDDETFL